MMFGLQEQADTANLLEKEFPGYEQIELLGEGAHGRVFRALDSILNRYVAIKLFKHSLQDEKSLQRFQLEAKSLASLKHPNIVEVYKQGLTSSGAPYFVMEYVHGMTLANYCHEKKLERAEFIAVFSEVLSALACAHQHNIIHRDIKPENIILLDSSESSEAEEQTGCGKKIKLLDFGIARFVDEEKALSLTKTGSVLGSPKYMSPEQCKGTAVDTRSDLYSLACVMYESLLGCSVFEAGSAAEYMYKHCNSSASDLVEANSQIASSELRVMLTKALQSDPSRRYQSAGEFLHDLQDLGDLPLLKTSQKKAGRSVHFKRLTLLLLVCLLAGAVLIMQAKTTLDPDSVVAVKTEEAQEDIAAAQKLLQAKDYSAALSLLQAACSESERQKNWKVNIDALYLLAKTYHDLGNHNKSVEVYEKLLKRSLTFGPMHESRATSKLWLGGELLCVNSLERAAGLLEDAVSDKLERRVKISEEHVAEARFLLAKIFFRQKRVDDAIDVLSKIWKHFICRSEDLTGACIDNLLGVLKTELKQGLVSQAKLQMREVPHFLENGEGLSREDLERACTEFVGICRKLDLPVESGRIEKICALKIRQNSNNPVPKLQSKERSMDPVEEFLYNRASQN